MKKLFLLSSLACWFGMNHAQAQFQLGVYGGYNFPAASQVLMTNEPVTSTFETVEGTLGTGINLGLTARYFFVNNLGARLDLGYTIGNTYESQSIVTGSFTRTTEMKGDHFYIAPMFTYRVPVGRVDFYGFMGPMLGICKVTTTQTETGIGASGGKDVDEYSGNMAWGWKGGTGAAFSLTDNLDLFLEGHINSLSYRPETAENTESYTGETRDATVTFVESRTATDPVTNVLQVIFPYSSIGVNLGVSWTFGGTTSTTP